MLLVAALRKSPNVQRGASWAGARCRMRRSVIGGEANRLGGRVMAGEVGGVG
jgi:hypothetical protein